ncbi:MAG TPA: glycosyltransferase, partial [Longimicrobiales bacterium]|nr:glycosyltransferase [Longimicrobiales bacterium]
FVLGGSLYPTDIPWPANVVQLPHVPPPRHPVFYSSAELSLNLTRGAMARSGYCPSGRLFEAAACGAAVLSDAWEGLDEFFEPGREILIAETTEDALRAVRLPASEKQRLGRAARERCLADHTADRRALELLALIGAAEHERASGDVAVEI